MEGKLILIIKKYGLYLVILILGILFGAFFFGGKEENKPSEEGTVLKHSYTCSMHPQISQPEKGSCPLCGMELIISSESTHALKSDQFRMTEDAIALANIETSVVSDDPANPALISLSGTITTNEKTNAVQTTLFDGRIDELDVNFVGEYVKKGQKIGLIYSPELYAAQDQLLTSASYKDSHQKLFDAARNALGLWKLTDEQINEILRTKKPMMNFPLFADVSGTVTEILATEGKYYRQGDPLFKLSKLNTVWAVFDAYESQLSFLKRGQEIRIITNVLKGEELRAKINFIEPILNSSKRTVKVRVTLNNSKGLLKPGMFVEGEVVSRGEQSQITIPRSAVLWTGKRSLVYLKIPAVEPTFEMVEVTLGDALQDQYVVLNGLKPKDEIVINGTFTLDAAAQLNRKRSMMGSGSLKSSGTSMASPLHGTDMQIQYSSAVGQKTNRLIGTYLELKDALVASKPDKATEAAVRVSELIKGMDSNLLDSTQQRILKEIGRDASTIANTTDLKQQRLAFKPLSEQMVALASKVQGFENALYVQFCPMADNNRGASWLSYNQEIRNPYFGDKMLTCGEVKVKLE